MKDHHTTIRRNRTVVITGAIAGIGHATAQAFAQQGESIGLLARDVTRLNQTKEEVARLGGERMRYHRYC